MPSFQDQKSFSHRTNHPLYEECIAVNHSYNCNSLNFCMFPSSVCIYFYGGVCFLHRQGRPFVALLFQRFEHLYHKRRANSLAATFLVKQDGEGRRIIIHMTVIVHDPRLDRSDHFASEISYQAVISYFFF